MKVNNGIKNRLKREKIIEKCKPVYVNNAKKSLRFLDKKYDNFVLVRVRNNIEETIISTKLSGFVLFVVNPF